MKTLLVVWAGQGGRTLQLAEAFAGGARECAGDEVRVEMRHALEAGPDELLAADALLFATPEKFGYMAGGLKDCFERCFYPCEHALAGRPFGVLVSAGNDGSGAVSSVRRIVTGWRMNEVLPVQVVCGEPDEAALEAAREAGRTLSAGLGVGLW
ncbi:NAD(P)H-dependent oxidoreductase [Crenobacter caeni]|uniref:Flavodoxin n=1 Tax=Crenobacter caeni TaxID=2705474 RepID=A0A6B2KN85_9NEIS|nr:NAD(P)H-dependent oxidoreductase [Crenobacter caeni]NDV11696.1 flavodoxin [Crenobacter caeni]